MTAFISCSGCSGFGEFLLYYITPCDQFLKVQQFFFIKIYFFPYIHDGPISSLMQAIGSGFSGSDKDEKLVN